jgi:hypothetical protein
MQRSVKQRVPLHPAQGASLGEEKANSQGHPNLKAGADLPADLSDRQSKSRSRPSSSQRASEINWPHPEVFDYVEYLAGFRAEFHDIRKPPDFRDDLSPVSYAASQRLTQVLIQEGSAGIVYPSVIEKKHGDCISGFRPAWLQTFFAESG